MGLDGAEMTSENVLRSTESAESGPTLDQHTLYLKGMSDDDLRDMLTEVESMREMILTEILARLQGRQQQVT